MAKLLPIEQNDQIVGCYFECPGCHDAHAVHIRPHLNSVGAGWTFNGDMDKPTFKPSILSKFTRSDGKTAICHSFVTDGRIQFLSDCTHSLAGQTVDLPQQGSE